MSRDKIVEEFRNKLKRLLKENANYLVADPNDPRVGILAREQIEGFTMDWLTKTLKDYKKEVLEDLLKKGHGGGNWRRLIITKLSKREK